MYLVEAYGAQSGDYEVLGVFNNEAKLIDALDRATPATCRRIRISLMGYNTIASPRGREYHTAQEYLNG